MKWYEKLGVIGSITSIISLGVWFIMQVDSREHKTIIALSALLISVTICLISAMIRVRGLKRDIKNNGITYRKKNKYLDNDIGAYLGELSDAIDRYSEKKKRYAEYPREQTGKDVEKALSAIFYNINEIIIKLNQRVKTHEEKELLSELVAKMAENMRK